MSLQHFYQLKQKPTDVWSIREKLALASAVEGTRDQNWASVSRQMKPFAEPDRPADWFSQKNCALQYGSLLENVEHPKRKRGEEIATPGSLIVKKLTQERIAELEKTLPDQIAYHQKLRSQLDMINSGAMDEKFDELIDEINREEHEKVRKEEARLTWLKEREIEAERQRHLRIQMLASQKPKKQHRTISDASDSLQSDDSNMAAPSQIVQSGASDGSQPASHASGSIASSSLLTLLCSPSNSPSQSPRALHGTTAGHGQAGESTSIYSGPELSQSARRAPANQSLCSSLVATCRRSHSTDSQSSFSGNTVSNTAPAQLPSSTSTKPTNIPSSPGVQNKQALEIKAEPPDEVKQELTEEDCCSIPETAEKPALSPALDADKLQQQTQSDSGNTTDRELEDALSVIVDVANGKAEPKKIVEANKQNEPVSVAVDEVPDVDIVSYIDKMRQDLEQNKNLPVEEQRRKQIIAAQLRQSVEEVARTQGEDDRDTLASTTAALSKSIKVEPEDQDLDASELQNPEPLMKPKKALSCKNVLQLSGGSKVRNESCSAFPVKVSSLSASTSTQSIQSTGESLIDLQTSAALSTALEGIDSTSTLSMIANPSHKASPRLSTPVCHSKTNLSLHDSSLEEQQVSNIDKEDEKLSSKQLSATLSEKLPLSPPKTPTGAETSTIDAKHCEPDNGSGPVEQEPASSMTISTEPPELDEVRCSPGSGNAQSITTTDGSSKKNETDYSVDFSKNCDISSEYSSKLLTARLDTETISSCDLDDKISSRESSVNANAPANSDSVAAPYAGDSQTETESRGDSISEGITAPLEFDSDHVNDASQQQTLSVEESHAMKEIHDASIMCGTEKREVKSSSSVKYNDSEDTISGCRQRLHEKSFSKNSPDVAKSLSESEATLVHCELTSSDMRNSEDGLKLTTKSEVQRALVSEGTVQERTCATREVDDELVLQEEDEMIEEEVSEEEDIDPGISSAPGDSASLVCTVGVEVTAGHQQQLLKCNDSASSESKSKDYSTASRSSNRISKVDINSANSEDDEADDMTTIGTVAEETMDDSRGVEEREREQKIWKKSALLVWRTAANHSHANVFMTPVTDEMAPGYADIVYRPMDLTTIRRRIESGAIKTTLELLRDFMLVFQNAIMYNSADHDVYYKARQMKQDVLQQMEEWMTNEATDKSATGPLLQSLRAAVGVKRTARHRQGDLATAPDALPGSSKKPRRSTAITALK